MVSSEKIVFQTGLIRFDPFARYLTEKTLVAPQFVERKKSVAMSGPVKKLAVRLVSCPRKKPPKRVKCLPALSSRELSPDPI